MNGGIEQNTGLRNKNKNKFNWNHKDNKALKKTLSKFVLLIRFSEINSADFFDKVRPYKVALTLKTVIDNKLNEGDILNTYISKTTLDAIRLVGKNLLIFNIPTFFLLKIENFDKRFL